MKVTVLTGAGISTESGIPDYRGPSGLWRKDPDHEKLVTYDYYMSDPEIRRRSWLFRRDNPAWKAEPNAGHRALAELAAAGVDVWIVTQNVDGLHQRAGSPPDRVLELHGNMFGAVCTACGARSATREAIDRVLAGDGDPACLACGGILKTATVMFGQALDPGVLGGAAEAAGDCELFVVVGTSLQVQPAASLVRIAVEGGARLIIVNGEPTPYDGLADEVIHEPISEALPRLAARLQPA
ncbi:NAD-dependent deacetylase [Planotetraspora sp. GP83]|uniref:SIR2 family NAD-dependent protein deacylase n=1 Tax=Planotetraspora sp. GP83 TaxID=3156264 RepID=UPI003518A996